ncbi:hypothetical protein F5B19DRAFT_445673 [Rostrohypoxylon terebratum]|nr:hypothetical protein F5B19DRAFT_445673 [Rostrohypoxylon terebratum]
MCLFLFLVRLSHLLVIYNSTTSSLLWRYHYTQPCTCICSCIPLTVGLRLIVASPIHDLVTSMPCNCHHHYHRQDGWSRSRSRHNPATFVKIKVAIQLSSTSAYLKMIFMGKHIHKWSPRGLVI